MVKHPNRILWTAIIAACTFDFLFWEKSPGTSFAIFVGITLSAGLYLARVENRQLAGQAAWLLLPIPALIQAQQNPQVPQKYRDELAAILACQITLIADQGTLKTWASYQWAEAHAWQLLKANRGNFSAARVYQNEYGHWWVMVNEEHRPCLVGLFEYD